MKKLANKVQQHIHCSVNNCHYWVQGNMCHANEILVTSDAVGSKQPDQFDAGQAQSMAATPVQSCMESCCKTFVDKNAAEINVDGVNKK